MEPAIELLGVYRVPGFDSEPRQSLQDFYLVGHAYSDTFTSVLDYIGRCIPLVLFDVVVSGADERFRFDHFTQEMEQAPSKAWQVAYDEALLDVDGCRVLARGLECGRKGCSSEGQPSISTTSTRSGQCSGPMAGSGARRSSRSVPNLLHCCRTGRWARRR
ncbi:MAG: hypothetical protein K1X67_20635 [Fimbriimonadaceae bacterium]|jgi:hypothetical protein|nr:hypothetical protein [Fimbriimonadaceae bacterium]